MNKIPLMFTDVELETKQDKSLFKLFYYTEHG